MFQIIRRIVFGVLKQFSKSDDIKILENEILIDIPRDNNLGDLYTNAAMLFAKKLKISPNVLASAICEALIRNENIDQASVAGPGFVNFKLKTSSWQKIINDILDKKEKYSFSNLENGASLNLEFVSANPTGPLHTGHARNAVFGSVVANLLEKIGYKVTKEFYINDIGNQIKSLARSLYIRYREALGADVSKNSFTEDMYCGEYVKDLAKNLADIYQDKFLNKEESEWLDTLCNFAVKKMMETAKKDLAILGITMDKYTSEAELCDKRLVDEALAILSKGENIYEGVLQRPKGISDSDEWEERPQTLFKSTKYGDDVDRALMKSDGTWTYFAGDLAYHLDKIKRGYRKMIAILGADHNGYVKRLKAAVKALSNGSSEIEIRLYQLVNFLENGKQIRMSKRAGNFITLKEVVDKVGKDITRYMMISRHHDVMIDFDFAKAVENSLENPMFYIQYAYARICSVFRNYETNFTKLSEIDLKNSDKSKLHDESELSLIKTLAFWPEQVKSAALSIEPHRIPTYLHDLASKFHYLWNKGKINTELRFIDTNNKADTLSRLSLLQCTKIVIEDGFKIIGVTPLSEMQ